MSNGSMGEEIIENAEKINDFISEKYPFYIIGVDENKNFDMKLFKALVNHFMTISKFKWPGETTMMTVRYLCIRDHISSQPRVILDFSKCCVHKMYSLVKDGTYTKYTNIIIEMNDIIESSNTAEEVFRKINLIKLKSKGKIIVSSLLKKAWDRITSWNPFP